MKKLYLGTNTKMYKTIKDTCEYLERLKALTAEIPKAVELFGIPSYTSLSRAGEILQDSRAGRMWVSSPVKFLPE